MNHINSPYRIMNSPYYHFHTKNSLLHKGQSFIHIAINSSFLNLEKSIKAFTIKRFKAFFMECSILSIASVFLRIYKNARVYNILRIDQN
jgi:hypothetical protein